MEDESPATGDPGGVLAQAADVTWIFFCLVLVILMQAGFACYEVGWGMTWSLGECFND